MWPTHHRFPTSALNNIVTYEILVSVMQNSSKLQGEPLSLSPSCELLAQTCDVTSQFLWLGGHWQCLCFMHKDLFR